MNFVSTWSVCNSSCWMHKRLASFGRTASFRFPVKVPYYVDNSWESTKVSQKSWIIIELLDEKHVKFTLHIIGRMKPDVRIKENARYSILHKLLSKPWIEGKKNSKKFKIDQPLIYKQL